MHLKWIWHLYYVSKEGRGFEGTNAHTRPPSLIRELCPIDLTTWAPSQALTIRSLHAQTLLRNLEL